MTKKYKTCEIKSYKILLREIKEDICNREAYLVQRSENAMLLRCQVSPN